MTLGNPQRIQRQRTKGWRMPPKTIYVGRPTPMGNPVRAGLWRGYTAADNDGKSVYRSWSNIRVRCACWRTSHASGARCRRTSTAISDRECTPTAMSGRPSASLRSKTYIPGNQRNSNKQPTMNSPMLAISFPPSELVVIDLTIRMFTQPALEGDVQLLGKIWQDEEKRKRALLEALGVGPADLQSADKFAALLRAEGVEPETKPGKNGPIYAFAKTDEFMRELLEDDDERIRTLAEARLGIKSTLDQSRSERLGFMAQRGRLAVYLNYCGTHTTLWSGGDGINYQNFKRGSELRKALRAPRGYLVAKVDQSQVQCRLAEYLGNEHAALEDFRQGKDPYIGLASLFYHRPITAADKPERQFGKVLRLQCQFGSGAATIQKSAKNAQIPVYLTDAEALEARDLYRRERPGVVQLWRDADRVLSNMVEGCDLTWLGILRVNGRTIVLPNGAPMHWPELQWDPEWQSYKFLVKRHHWKRIWGGFLVQNIVSGLASTLVRQAMLRIANMGLRVVLNEHDAVAVLVLDNDDKETTLQKIIDEMRRPPPWAPDLPLDAEGSLGATYS